MRIAIFALAVLVGSGAAEARQVEVISGNPRLEIAAGAQPVRIVSKRLPTLRRAIATAQFGRGVRYMCGQGSLSAVFLVNE